MATRSGTAFPTRDSNLQPDALQHWVLAHYPIGEVGVADRFSWGWLNDRYFDRQFKMLRNWQNNFLDPAAIDWLPRTRMDEPRPSGVR